MPHTQPQEPATWSQHDSALWYTLDILAAWLGGGLEARPPVLTPFAPSLGQGERVLTEGSYQLSEYVALGDGSYDHSTFIAGGTGLLGMTLLAGTIAGSAIGNSRRRAEAERDARERWHPVAWGTLAVSTHGFYLTNQYGLNPWSWYGVSAATVVGPGAVHLQGQGSHGPTSWIVQSDWAELLFVAWAVTRHRHHPQLVTGSWLPPGWVQRATRSGYMPRRQMDEIARALPAG
jgi:hypothetical protein